VANFQVSGVVLLAIRVHPGRFVFRVAPELLLDTDGFRSQRLYVYWAALKAGIAVAVERTSDHDFQPPKRARRVLLAEWYARDWKSVLEYPQQCLRV
jgi:hypothetical protein